MEIYCTQKTDRKKTTILQVKFNLGNIVLNKKYVTLSFFKQNIFQMFQLKNYAGQ